MGLPTLAVMASQTFAQQFDSRDMQMLNAVADLLTAEPVTDFHAAAPYLDQAEVLLTSWGCPPITTDVLDAAPKLRAIVHAAGSVRDLVPDEAYARGIQVTTAADVNAVPVAEFTLAATIFAGKRAWPLAQRQRVAPTSWSASFATAGLSNFERTIGVIGFSRIGQRYIDLLSSLNTRRILVADPIADPAAVAAAGAEHTDLHTLLGECEIVSIHAPLLPETIGMIGEQELALLPEGATLINTARGALVDHDALYRECATGRIDAILDVTDPEPLPAGHQLLGLPNVMVTPHIAGSLGSETHRLTHHAIEAIAAFAAGGELPDAVTIETGKVSA